jgi:uncharacterized protein YqhQ
MHNSLTHNPSKEREARLYGGQAIIEGVMMKGPTKAVASVRTPDGKIVSHTIREWPEKKRLDWKKIPFIRGIFILIDSLTLGIAALKYSAKVALPEEEQESSPLWENLAFTVSFVIGIGLFVIFPTKLPEWVGLKAHGEILRAFEWRSILLNLFEGAVRIAIFIGYIIAISFLKDIRRVFQYHGAEHKTVNAYESHVPMTVENIQKLPTAHFRCGTSFIFIVAILHILIASLFGWPNIWIRIATRILILFPVAAISYELLRLSARFRTNPISRMFFAPGILFQKITSLEPDDNMVEVALDAFSQVIPTDSASAGAPSDSQYDTR